MFLQMCARGWSQSRAAAELGRSKSWAYQVAKRYGIKPGVSDPNKSKTLLTNPVDLPSPKKYEDLDGGVRDTLKDFLLFRREFFCRDEQPWTRDVASRTVEWLMNKEDRDFVVQNMPPGVGKSTILMDIFLWLICGGGSQDPAWGRALRLMWGSDTKNVSIHATDFLRRTLESPRPFYDKKKKARADEALAIAFGRFRPKATEGENLPWRAEQFTVAQIGDFDVYDKEPTVQAASREAGFLGERVDMAVWDDLVVTANSNAIEKSEALSVWFENEAEERVEPGGLLVLNGQRISSLDLFRNRLNTIFKDEHGAEHRIYKHVVYPAHHEDTCINGGTISNSCTQWDGHEQGCILDINRFPIRDLQRKAAKSNWATVFQQNDSNPESILVQPAWIEGGTDPWGYVARGCLDRERGFYEWPAAPYLIDGVTVDPAAGNFWGIQWWALNPDTGVSSLIFGKREKMVAGTDRGFLDYDPDTQRLVGFMPEMQERSGAMGHPIRVWVVEQNAAHKYLFQTLAFKRFKETWPLVEVITHQTGKNKNDVDYGVEAVLPMRYREGFVRLPYRRAEDNITLEMKHVYFTNIFKKELTNYPDYPTTDLVMAHWFWELNRERIKQIGNRFREWGFEQAPANIPRYLRKQRHDVLITEG